MQRSLLDAGLPTALLAALTGVHAAPSAPSAPSAPASASASASEDSAAESGSEPMPGAARGSATKVWDFQVALDGRPIGRHRFSLSADGGRRTLVSDANFAVKIIGITAYQYHHRATEHWRGDCLAALVSTTDDDGKSTSVRSEQTGDSFSVTSPAPESAPGCVMSYAYWNPAMRSQPKLLNPQTGRIDPVRISRIGHGTVDLHGQPVAATQYRIEGPNPPVDVWYSEMGDWIALDATVRGGRRLAYRLP